MTRKEKQGNNPQAILILMVEKTVSPDTLSHIFSCLSFKDRASCEKVCKQWQSASQKQLFYQELARTRFQGEQLPAAYVEQRGRERYDLWIKHKLYYDQCLNSCISFSSAFGTQTQGVFWIDKRNGAPCLAPPCPGLHFFPAPRHQPFLFSAEDYLNKKALALYSQIITRLAVTVFSILTVAYFQRKHHYFTLIALGSVGIVYVFIQRGKEAGKLTPLQRDFSSLIEDVYCGLWLVSCGRSLITDSWDFRDILEALTLGAAGWSGGLDNKLAIGLGVKLAFSIPAFAPFKHFFTNVSCYVPWPDVRMSLFVGLCGIGGYRIHRIPGMALGTLGMLFLIWGVSRYLAFASERVWRAAVGGSAILAAARLMWAYHSYHEVCALNPELKVNNAFQDL